MMTTSTSRCTTATISNSISAAGKLDDVAGNNDRPFTLPAGSVIPEHSFLVFFSNQTHIALNNSSPGDSVRLLHPDGSVADETSYTATQPDRAHSRTIDGGGTWVTTYPPSPGQPNQPLPPTSTPTATATAHRPVQLRHHSPTESPSTNSCPIPLPTGTATAKRAMRTMSTSSCTTATTTNSMSAAGNWMMWRPHLALILSPCPPAALSRNIASWSSSATRRVWCSTTAALATAFACCGPMGAWLTRPATQPRSRTAPTAAPSTAQVSGSQRTYPRPARPTSHRRPTR